MGANASKNLEYYNYTSMRLLDSANGSDGKRGENFREYDIHELIEKARATKNSDFNESYALYIKCLKCLKRVKNEKSKIYKDVVEFEIKPNEIQNDILLKCSSTEKIEKGKEKEKEKEKNITASTSSINTVNTNKTSNSSSSSITNEDHIKINKKIACLYNELGDLFCIHDYLEKSLLYYEKACSYDPSKIDYIYKKGVVYQQMNEVEKAIRTFKRILATNETHIPTLFAIGNLYRYINANTALTYFETILKEEPNNTEVLSLVASCYNELGNLNKAISYQNKAVQINPDNFNHKKFAQKLIETKMQN